MAVGRDWIDEKMEWKRVNNPNCLSRSFHLAVFAPKMRVCDVRGTQIVIPPEGKKKHTFLFLVHGDILLLWS